jgi:hypothetical protein
MSRPSRNVRFRASISSPSHRRSQTAEAAGGRGEALALRWGTSDRDRKRMLRLLIEDVTLVKGQEAIAVHVRFRGGGTRSVSLPRPLPAWKSWLTPTETVAQVDRARSTQTAVAARRVARAPPGSGRPRSSSCRGNLGTPHVLCRKTPRHGARGSQRSTSGRNPAPRFRSSGTRAAPTGAREARVGRW